MPDSPCLKHRLRRLQSIMAEASSSAELANFFMTAVSIVFGVWQDRVQASLSLKRPLAYAERHGFAQEIFATLTSRVLPLALLIGAFLVAFLPVTIDTILSSHLTFSKKIDAAVTVFCLLYWFLFYLFAVVVSQFFRLLGKLKSAAEGRKPDQPRLRWL